MRNGRAELDRLRYQARRYLTKHAEPSALLAAPVPGDLGLVAIVPCHDEPTIEPLLQSLWRAHRPDCAAEVLLLVNAGEAAGQQVQARNRALLRAAAEFSASYSNGELALHAIWEPALPIRHAGVGLARKLAMDEALRRLAASDRARGVILSLDADCRVDASYWRAVEDHFHRQPRAAGVSIYFEHDGADSGATAIGRYELYLRYYRHALRLAGHPHAFHTVGSAMAVASDAYAAVGGMNRRQAGEDFYFLKKLMLFGGFADITATTVRPSGRVSSRVPFGTGRAMERLTAQDGPLMVPALQGFQALKPLFQAVCQGVDPAAFFDGLDPGLRNFLEQRGWRQRWSEIERNTASPHTFGQRFFAWFDGLKVRQWLNDRRANGAPDVPVETAAGALLAELGVAPAVYSAGDLCRLLRSLDRGIASRATRFSGQRR